VIEELIGMEASTTQEDLAFSSRLVHSCVSGSRIHPVAVHRSTHRRLRCTWSKTPLPNTILSFTHLTTPVVLGMMLAPLPATVDVNRKQGFGSPICRSVEFTPAVVTAFQGRRPLFVAQPFPRRSSCATSCHSPQSNHSSHTIDS